MRVLLTVPSLAREFGGPAGKARGLADALRTVGAEVRLVSAGEEDGYGVTPLGEVTRFHATPVPRAVHPLRRLIPGADVVHVLGFRDPVGTIAALEARRSRVPYVLEPAGMIRRRLRSQWLKRAFDDTVGRTIVQGAAAVIATSRLEAAELQDGGVAPERIRVRPNGVGFDALLPLPERGQFRRRHNIPAEAPLVLTIARIGAVKGLRALILAVMGVPGCSVAIAGPDEHDGTLGDVMTLLRLHQLRDHVLVLPNGIWGDDKREALADADLFCLPSAYESFGTAAAEAAGCGLPVVTTSGCGVAEVLAPSATRVVPPGEVDALADAIRQILASGTMREAARRSAPALRKRLDWRILAADHIQIYRDVIGT